MMVKDQHMSLIRERNKESIATYRRTNVISNGKNTHLHTNTRIH